MANRNIMPWSNEEVQTFLSLVADDRIQRELEGATRNEKVYQEVSDLMAAHGYQRTSQQCREKLKKLKSDYRSIKDLRGRGGTNRKNWRWFDRMHAIYGREEGGLDSAPTWLQSLMEEAPKRKKTRTRSSSVEGKFHHWSVEETRCLLALWSSDEVQDQLEGASRTKPVYEQIQRHLAAAGYDRNVEQIINKIKKLKREYRGQNMYIGGRGGGRSRRNPHFDVLDSVFGDKPQVCQMTGESPDSPSATLEVMLDDDTLSQSSTDEIQWMSDEVQVLMTLWAQPNIQEQLLSPTTNQQVFTYLSNELTLVGFNKTADQCRVKVDSLKEEYNRIKDVTPDRDVKGDWFDILDSVLGADGEADTSGVLLQPKSPEDEYMNDALQAIWTSDEVKALLIRWSEESVQEQLRSSPGNLRVFAQLSSQLASQGFYKTTSQCFSKIQLLKQKYRRIKEQNDSKKQKSRWFAIMDEVLGRHDQEAEDSDFCLETPQQDPSEAAGNLGGRLSLSSLCLLVPTLRLMCAFAWQVVQCCNVAHYGKVEELVRLVTELVPELLTPREKVQVLLRLRARLVLELCRCESTANLSIIEPHLMVIQNLEIGSDCHQQEVEELENSKSNFVDVVHSLLEDPAERNMFFKETFSVHYGQQYQATLNTIVWKFISKLDHLLPVPDIIQTAQWLSTAPSVMEECGRLVLEADQMKSLMHFHLQMSGNLNTYYSDTQNMFLPRLSLPHKANLRAATHQDPATVEGDEEQSGSSDNEDFVEDSDREETGDNCGKRIEDTQLQDEQNLQTYKRAYACPDNQASEPRTPEELEPDSVPPHVTSETPEMESTANTCEHCGRVVNDLSACLCSRETCTYDCDKCEKKYASKSSLIVHRLRHTGETPYLCSHCGRGFRTSNSLEMHIRIHTGDRRYKCDICGKTSIQHLARHMRMHRGEKNYLCTECGKAFLSSGELRLHTRYHTGERPYSCKHCGRGFIAKCLLTRHIRQHTGERPYRCSVCPKSFPTLRSQKRHLKIHLKRKSYCVVK